MKLKIKRILWIGVGIFLAFISCPIVTENGYPYLFWFAPVAGAMLSWNICGLILGT